MLNYALYPYYAAKKTKFSNQKVVNFKSKKIKSQQLVLLFLKNFLFKIHLPLNVHFMEKTINFTKSIIKCKNSLNQILYN